VAAVFAIHPLRVESVAWVTERKDVLSGVFFMLVLASYARYALGPSPMRYLATLLLFALGLMSKSMLVTLPFVLLLLDYWPLGRFSDLRRVLLEKVPFFILSIALCAVQIFADKKGLVSIENMPLSWRAGNAVVSYAVYIGQMFYPANLAAFYPHQGSHLPAWEIACSLLLLAGISATAFALRRTRPYLLVGWLWYLGMLVPVIGIVQSGVISRADRYTYLPQIGLYLMITWTVSDLCARWRYRGVFAGFAATAVLIPLVVFAYIQTSYWRNSEILWNHALASTPDNTVVHDNLGNVFLDNRQIDKAIEQSKKSLAIDRSDYLAHNNLGLAYIINGQVDAAIEQFEITLKIYPDYTIGHINLGGAFAQNQKVDQAIAQFRKALEADPDNTGVHYSLSHVLMLKGRVDEAIVNLRKVLDNQPHNATAHYNLGLALAQKGLDAEAATEYRKALEDQPRYGQAENNLAWLLATSTQDSVRNGTEAVKLAQQASRHPDDNDPTVLDTLAAAYAEAGRFSDAVETAERALTLAGKQGDKTLAANLRKELAFYQAGKPFRDDGK
jgi:tetratricopeptide (TPR) repeat protein